MSNIKQELQQILSQAAKKITGLEVKPEAILIEHPSKENFGDYSSNIALILAGKTRKKPQAIAQEIVKELKSNSTIRQPAEKFNNLTIAGPGFINITLRPDYFFNELQEVIKEGSKYGQNQYKKGKKVMVEYAHPNTHKAFHIGHLRNIINGEAIIRILEARGIKVIRVNYQGDVGLHIAKCLWFLCKGPTLASDVKARPLHERIELLGKAYTAGNQAYESDKEAKKQILEINKKIYSHEDPQINKLWRETRQWSLDYFEELYKRVDSHFDRYYFESEVYKRGKELVLAGMKKGIFKKSKGAVIFPGSKFGLHDRVFITSEGNTTYEGKDMGLGELQFKEFEPDLIIHNVGPEQKEYFKVVFTALAQLFPETKGKEEHLMYGWVRLKKGKMSSRTGNVILGEWLLDEAKTKIIKDYPEIDQKTAEMVAMGAVKYSFLKVSPPTEVAFDFEESINLEGNSGPYLQYTYARCQSVLAKAKTDIAKLLNCQIVNFNEEEMAVLRTIYKFPEAVEQAGKSYSPNLICNFLYDLAQKYNAFYNKHRILDSTMKQFNNLTIFRLTLTAATSQILKNGLYILGIKTPIKM